VQQYAVVIPFPARRQRRRERAVAMFSPWIEAAALERAQQRLFWSCVAAGTLLTFVFNVVVG
jgi:hypothetical protein